MSLLHIDWKVPRLETTQVGLPWNSIKNLVRHCSFYSNCHDPNSCNVFCVLCSLDSGNLCHINFEPINWKLRCSYLIILIVLFLRLHWQPDIFRRFLPMYETLIHYVSPVFKSGRRDTNDEKLFKISDQKSFVCNRKL